MERLECDLAVIGGGIVGLATARAFAVRHPDLRIVVLEKEDGLARHQTGHNSGVVHAGIYYRPGTLRARLCVQGVAILRDFCRERGIAYDPVGKVIVATDDRELPRLDALLERGRANGVAGLRRIGPDELREIEPHAAGVAAIHSPNTAIVDFPAVARACADEVTARGGRVELGARVTSLAEESDGVRIGTPGLEVRASRLVACAGLHADRLARLAGLRPEVRIVPFRGEYYVLAPERRELVSGLIYPVPDPRLPFLGVHFTRTVHGDVEAGPNAVLAFAREGYTRWRLDARELGDTLAFAGFWRLAGRFWRTGAFEAYRSFVKAAFVASLRRLVPAVRPDDLVPGGAGVRAQAIGPDGALVDDFALTQTERSLHVLNAPSPAATASLAIGEHLLGRGATWFA